ncbi:hypothetical protein AVEN_98841-1 [Araneus ventricosus]|uniref:Uncharacterized protein n=1 Tax=Araneus ventricosus TaxID=182803 RepID=A0A4Y2M495_ARAVE|nr:hypothetical protein AVEN_98841-1 [Araneus ventricosus]
METPQINRNKCVANRREGCADRVLGRKGCPFHRFLHFRDHQCGTLFRHPHQTEVHHSTQETSALESRGDDNARSNTATNTKVYLLGWERWDDQGYSNDLAPSDIPIFSVWKSALSVCHFRNKL